MPVGQSPEVFIPQPGALFYTFKYSLLVHISESFGRVGMGICMHFLSQQEVDGIRGDFTEA